MDDRDRDTFDDARDAEDDALFDDEGEPRGGSRQRFDADYLLDKVIPDEIDWRDLVRRHPLVSVSLAAGFGFLLGRAKGAAILAGVSAAVTGAVMRQLTDVLDGEVF